MNTPKANRLPTFKKLTTQTVSTGKKAIAETNSHWKRKNLNTISLDEKELLVKKISALINVGAKVGRDLIVGFNSVMKLIESGQAEIVCIALDGNALMLKHLVEAAKTKSVVTVSVPKLSQSIRSELKLKSALCFAIKRENSEATDEEEEERSETEVAALLDDLREFLLAL